MPRNLSAWIDLTIHLLIMLILIGVLSYYNLYIAAIAGLVWLALASFARERCADRSRRFERYCRNVVRNINEMLNYAVDELPQAIMIVNEDGRIQWCNDRMEVYFGKKPEQDTDVKDLLPGIIVAPIWGQEGEYVFANSDKYYHVYYHPVQMAPRQEPLMTLYIQDVTSHEQLKNTFQQSRTVLVYIQIDNYDEVMQGQTEAERTSLLLAVNQTIDKWMKNLGGFMRRINEDLYVVISNRLPVTLSMGIAVAENQTMAELGAQAQAGLDLALGRGGDQVAVQMNGKTQFFGGKAKAVEKHTRVKARVVAHALREIMEGADEIYIMGHHNEDFDCFGAAMGVAKMARQLEKNFHIVLSDMNDGIDKFHDLLKDKEEYEGVFVHAMDIKNSTALSPVLIVVDTHIPHLVADPTLLERVHQVVVIDHHRRSENFIKNPLLVYIEPGASSTSELITELLMYFGEDIRLGRLDATALYSGIVVDTKNFAIQTGVRTFDAAAFLRRSGADPVMVRHLFRSDYETTVALAKTIQVIAAQAADGLLRIENVRMSILIFQLTEDTIGLSARSTGDLNVQVIMEALGGGGHQNVAGAQVKGASLADIKAKVIEISEKYIEENDKDESDSAAGR